jgi:hypothetical protein
MMMMMKTEEIVNNVDSLLSDRGLVKEYKEQAVRLLLYHLYVAIDIYRYMTVAERNKAGYWYRIFKGSYTLRNFLKERKRKRDKEKSPLHPSYKKESGVKEKAQSTHTYKSDAKPLENRKRAFYMACHKYDERYGKSMVDDFYVHWSEEDADRQKMRFELEETWSTAKRLFKWSKDPQTIKKKLAEMQLAKAEKKSAPQTVNTQEQQAIAAKRAEDNEKLEREIAENKAGAVSYEEYIRRKNKTTT